MRPTDIPDKDIPAADPGTLIIQYTPLINKIAQRYRPVLETTGSVDIEDLLQAGRIAIYNAQKHYDPEGGSTFLSFSFNWIRNAMQNVLGFKNGKAPLILEYLDEPLSDEGEDTRLDYIPDPSPTAEDKIIEQDSRNETAEAVHAAINRLKNEKHREIINRVYLQNQDRQTAAAEMGMKVGSFRSADYEARCKLGRDRKLQRLWFARPMINSGIKRFNETWSSSIEELVLWKEKVGYYESSNDLGR